ncbi:MAG: copper homeostasis protein CutC [Terriglobales bacterium]
MNQEKNSTSCNRVLLEVCVTSPDYALAAQRAGADRIELCCDLDCGGLTPGARLMEAARKQLQIPIHVLIRPRPGDFVYSASEFQAMRKAIQTAKDLKMDGIVLGILDQNSHVDVARTRQLVELAHPLPVTFHRAFDETDTSLNASLDSLEAVIETGATRLLTSGGRPKAIEGLSTLARLIKEASGRVSVMPAGGITPANVSRVVTATSAREVHGTLLTSALRKRAEGADRHLQTERYYRRIRKATLILQQL